MTGVFFIKGNTRLMQNLIHWLYLPDMQNAMLAADLEKDLANPIAP